MIRYQYETVDKGGFKRVYGKKKKECTEGESVVKVVTGTFRSLYLILEVMCIYSTCMCVRMSALSEAATVHTARGSLSVTQSLQSAVA